MDSHDGLFAVNLDEGTDKFNICLLPKADDTMMSVPYPPSRNGPVFRVTEIHTPKQDCLPERNEWTRIGLEQCTDHPL